MSVPQPASHDAELILERTEEFGLRPSPPYAAVLAVLHVLAAGSLALALPGPWGVAAALLLGILGTRAVLEHALLRSSRSPRTLRLGASGTAELRLGDGRILPIAAQGGMGVTRWWVAVRTREGRGRALLIPAGMLLPAQHRLLRLWAIWGKLTAPLADRPRAATEQLAS